MRRFGVLTLALVILSGCATSQRPSPAYDLVGGSLHETRERVLETAKSLIGTPYRWGGTTPKGFDCSGYIKYVYRQAAGLSLPRRSKDQVRVGAYRSQRELRPADLVYFRIGGKSDLHIGIYLGDNRFIHAPSSNGAVNIQSLTTDYWRHRFLGGRQILSL